MAVQCKRCGCGMADDAPKCAICGAPAGDDSLAAAPMPIPAQPTPGIPGLPLPEQPAAGIPGLPTPAEQPVVPNYLNPSPSPASGASMAAMSIGGAQVPMGGQMPAAPMGGAPVGGAGGEIRVSLTGETYEVPPASPRGS